MSKAYSEDRFPAPNAPPKLKKVVQAMPADEKLPEMTKEATFYEGRNLAVGSAINK